jgi:hypothetical protein
MSKLKTFNRITIAAAIMLSLKLKIPLKANNHQTTTTVVTTYTFKNIVTEGPKIP